MFGLAIIPIIGFVGAAVDYGHANLVKTAMQNALDSTALMLSRDASDLSQADLNATALAYFTATFNRPEVTGITVSASYDASNGSAVSVSASGEVPTDFMQILGYNDIAVAASSTSKWGNTRLRVALVLDNTGSMNDDGKIGALKTATSNLLDQLESVATNPEDVYVSIVPFVKDVSFDKSQYSSSWDSANGGFILWDDGDLDHDNYWDALNGTCSSSHYSTRSSCLSHGSCSLHGYDDVSDCQAAGTCSISGYTSQSTCTNAGTCSISGYISQNSCTNAAACSNPGQTTRSSCTGTKACSKSGYTSKNKCTQHGGIWGYGTWTTGVWTAGVWTAGTWSTTWTPDSHSTWNGCITDRGDPDGPASDYDRLVTAPTSSIPATLFPAEQYSSCPKPILGLNNNWSAMNTLVNSMVANGSTNQPIGLVWGWQTLVGGGPFTAPSMDSNYTYQQIIILLSDGLNTQDRWYGNGSDTNTSVDYRMYDNNGNGTCANIKGSGVTIYTIQVNTGGDPTSTLLSNCASDSSKFFMLTSASQIITTFQQIATQISKLRITQ